MSRWRQIEIKPDYAPERPRQPKEPLLVNLYSAGVGSGQPSTRSSGAAFWSGADTKFINGIAHQRKVFRRMSDEPDGAKRLLQAKHHWDPKQTWYGLNQPEEDQRTYHHEFKGVHYDWEKQRRHMM